MSPRLTARLAGISELLEGVASACGQVFIPGSLIVAGSAAATAANVLGHERLVWLGFASSLAGVGFHIVWALLMYELLKPASRFIASLAVFVILVGCAVQAVQALLYIAPMLVLQSGSALSAFTPGQLQALAYAFFKLSGYAFDVYLVFFGLWCVLTGILIFRSTFMPRALGVLLTVSGLGWMLYVVPPLAHSISAYIAGASALGELPLQLWLIVMAVNASKWAEAASRPRA